ncbi:MAG: hypothetical protein ACYSSI_01390 [Planctomycetota bacterium]|jgi:hypothetical protein
MNNFQENPKNLIDTTDCLEAIGVFKGWKNFLFIIVLVCFLLLQFSFWLVDAGFVKSHSNIEPDQQAKREVINPPAAPQVEKTEAAAPGPADTNEIAQAAKEATADVNTQPQAQAEEPVPVFSFLLDIDSKSLIWFVRFFDFVIIPAAILYCLTMLFCLKVSMLGRLGGINHISRAFFLSLVFVVLLMPWQKLFGGIVAGVIYTPKELLDACNAVKDGGIFIRILHYLRFVIYWILALSFLIFSHLRSIRWARATLHRLEVI